MSGNKSGNMIFEYIRKRRGGQSQRIGVITGELIEGEVCVGWSKSNLKAGDHFNLKKGLQIAIGRGYARAENTPPVPRCVERQAKSFVDRCKRYFKGHEVQDFVYHARPPKTDVRVINQP